jgi:GntR family hexuronate regulon transcriptional repressor
VLPAELKLYQKIALAVAEAISRGRHAPGTKLPSERELADEFGVSRPTVRDAMIALEFQGLVEARRGSGVYVTTAAPPVPDDATELEVDALEWTEARRLFEGEACALSAAVVTQEQLATLDRLLNEMNHATDVDLERLEQEFHMKIALATSNAAIAVGAEELWALRQQSPPCVAMLRRARKSGGNFIAQHREILAALRERDSKAARQAIHSHLAQVIDHLLTLTEVDAVEQTRQKMAEQRNARVRRNEI